MLQNVINSIVSAEERADVIVKEATQKAKDDYQKAKADADKILKDNSNKVKEEVRNISAEANIEAKKAYDEIIKNGKKTADKTLKDSKDKTIEASNFIARRILEKYGDS